MHCAVVKYFYYNKTVRNLKVVDFKYDFIDQAVELDKKWFGEYGANEDDFKMIFATENRKAIALVDAKVLKGFAVFDILESGREVQDYKGLTTTVKTAFIQQFTTTTNYKLNSWEHDTTLLMALEKSAEDLHCLCVWEALSKDHPFASENNPGYDAYGFYENQGYSISIGHSISWREMVPCNLLSKNLKIRCRT